MVAVTNEIGEIGVIRWNQKKSDNNVPKQAEREWLYTWKKTLPCNLTLSTKNVFSTNVIYNLILIIFIDYAS